MIELPVFGVRLNCRRGLLRLGSGLVTSWFVFWTFAYVLYSPSSENQVSPPAFSLSTEIALAVTVLLLVPWIVAGFRAE
jgi:hypothetical protein